MDRDEKKLDLIFTAHAPIDSVIHFAGLKAVGESVALPVLYYENNLISSLALLKVCGTTIPSIAIGCGGGGGGGFGGGGGGDVDQHHVPDGPSAHIDNETTPSEEACVLILSYGLW